MAPGDNEGPNATPPVAPAPSFDRAPKPVLGGLLGGTSLLALQVPLQIVLSLWSLRLIVEAVGRDGAGAYRFAWGFGLLQLLFEFGVGSALQRRISDAWTRGDRAAIDRGIAVGMNAYTAMAIVQAAVLLGVAYFAVPYSGFVGNSHRLVIRLLWPQAVTAPCFSIAVVVSSVLQAARRYEVGPRYELVITLLRFAVLVLGVRLGVDFFAIVVAQTAVILALRIGPASWVMVHELGLVPHFRGALPRDYKELGRFGFCVVLIQVGVMLTDKIDTTVLGFVLADPGPQIAAYDVVSRPFLMLRQSGTMLASLVIPAAAALMVAGDGHGLERVKYDGTRLHVGVLLPVGLLAWLHAGPFLSLWFGRRLGYDASALAPLMRLFLVATIPLALSVPVQVAVGVGRVRVVALAALAGSLIDPPLSCLLTAWLGMAGVIWGTVLTTLVSNLLVPGLYVFRNLEIDPRVYLARSLAAPLAGAAGLVGATWALRHFVPVAGTGPTFVVLGPPLLLHLVVGSLAYLGCYSAAPCGLRDLAWLMAVVRRGRSSRPA